MGRLKMSQNWTTMRFSRADQSVFIVFLMFFVAFECVVFAENTSIIQHPKECGGEFSGYQYTIRSPYYPEGYPEKQNCIYNLRGSSLAKCDQTFNLQFLDFSLAPSENCAEDYLEIGDRSLYCGRVVGIRSYPSKDNKIVLRFHSGATKRSDRGFRILVTTLPCSEAQINTKKRIELEAESRPAVGQGISNNGKVGSPNAPENIFLKSGNSYPVYRPNVESVDRDREEFIRGEVPSPPRVESLDERNENSLLKIQDPSSFGINGYPSNSLQIPGYQSKFFRAPSSTNLELVTPSSIISKETKTSKISAYLFVPPPADKYPTRNLVENLPSTFFVTPPSTEILLPIRTNGVFRNGVVTNYTRNRSHLQNRQKTNEKYVVPVASYGVPDEPLRPLYEGSVQDIKTGEVLDSSRDVVDCQGGINLEPDLEVTENFPGRNPVVFADTGLNGGSRIGNYPATRYGSPVSRYPLYTTSGNSGIIPFTKYERPNVNVNDPSVNYPVESDGSIGRFPSWVPDGGSSSYQNFISSVGIGPGNGYPVTISPGNLGGYPECCNTVHSGQRLLLASPGFPSLFHQDNPYDCIYSIRSYSPNICRMRFNFQFFNHGTEDQFCSNGYVEIDGRRICGCRKGLSVVSIVNSQYPKIIGVRYTGQPRTKFNGFLIEVIQETCSNNYPYLSRNKKDVGNSSREDNGIVSERNPGTGNNTSQRTKRNLGYSYPKPNVGLSEDLGASTGWNSGTSMNSHQARNEGSISANFYSPLLTCKAVTFFDWTIAAKETYLRNAKCRRPGNYPDCPPNTWVPANGSPGINIPPGTSGIGGPGIISPGYPGNGGPGTIPPGYPVAGGSGAILPGYPGSGGSGTISPVYPGNGVPGLVPPGSGVPGFIPSGNGGSGTIIPGNPGSGGWNFPSAICEDINVSEGIISSPQFPANYPNNVKKCFRFYKAPDVCRLELAILAFDLERSGGCTKDYVTFGGNNRRYCDGSLAGSSLLFDVSRRNAFDVCFVSDGFGSGRGFNIGFSQIPCQRLGNR